MLVRHAAVTFVAISLAAATAHADGRPAILQAQALLAEHEGDTAKALELLREANAASPQDVDIAFDRARIALEHSDQAKPEDLDASLAVEPITSEQYVLRAYVLTARDRLDDAREAAERAADLDPKSEEAATLVEALAPADGATPRVKPIAVRAKLFGQYDTNVSVLPDQLVIGSTTVETNPIDSLGLGAEADVRWTPVRGVTELSFAGGASFLGHLTNRNVDEGAKQFDYGTFDLSARARFTGDRWLTTIELLGTAIFIDDYAERFLTEGDLIASTGYAVGSAKALRIGAYGIGAARSFGNTFDQRNGTRLEGGLTLDWQALRNLGLGLRGGYQSEQTTEPEFDEGGPTAMAYAQSRFGRLDALVALTYQRRDFRNVPRVDNRLGPQATLSYNLDDTFFIVGSYLYLHNSSTSQYDYQRHLVTVGVEARF
jgi:tetratricopeptide (TPR) repeat protein